MSKKIAKKNEVQVTCVPCYLQVLQCKTEIQPRSSKRNVRSGQAICRTNLRKNLYVQIGKAKKKTRNGRKKEKKHAKEKLEAKETGYSKGVVYSLLDKGESRARKALEVLNDFLKL